MLERPRVRMDLFKEHEMNTQPQPQGSGCTPTVLMIIGGAITLFALAGALALHLWSQSTPYAGGEDINAIVASILIVAAGVPVFFIGLVLLLVGVSQRMRGKRKAA